MRKFIDTDGAIGSAYYAAVAEADIAADAEMEAYLADMQAGYLAGSLPDEDEIDAMAEDDTILVSDAEIERVYHEAQRVRHEAAAAWVDRQLEACEIDDSDWDSPGESLDEVDADYEAFRADMG